MREGPVMTHAASEIRMSQQGIDAGLAGVSLTTGKGWSSVCALESYGIIWNRIYHTHGLFMYMDMQKKPLAFLYPAF